MCEDSRKFHNPETLLTS